MTTPTQAQTAEASVPPEALPFVSWAGDGKMTCRQIAILLTVQANPGLSVGTIAALLDTPKPAVTRAADKLAQYGLLRRKLCSFDRRLVELWPISKKGRRNV